VLAVFIDKLLTCVARTQPNRHEQDTNTWQLLKNTHDTCVTHASNTYLTLHGSMIVVHMLHIF